MQHPQQAFHLLGRGHHVVIHSQFVAQRGCVLAQKAVVVERANEVFHHLLLPFRQVVLSHLPLQFVVEGGPLRQRCFVSLFAVVVSFLQVSGHIVGRQVVGQFVVVLSVFLVGRVVVSVVGRAGFVVVAWRVGVILLQCRVVQHLVAHTLRQVRHGQFHEFGHGNLHCCQLLCLLLRCDLS